MTYLPFLQVDVFSERHGDGNPLAVVLDAQSLPERALKRFAAWTNLSETTFLLPPSEAGRAGGADYRQQNIEWRDRRDAPGGQGEQGRGNCQHRVGAGRHLTPRVAIGDGAGDWHQQEDGQQFDGADQPERPGAGRLLVEVPAHRNRQHLQAQHRPEPPARKAPHHGIAQGGIGIGGWHGGPDHLSGRSGLR